MNREKACTYTQQQKNGIPKIVFDVTSYDDVMSVIGGNGDEEMDENKSKNLFLLHRSISIQAYQIPTMPKWESVNYPSFEIQSKKHHHPVQTTNSSSSSSSPSFPSPCPYRHQGRINHKEEHGIDTIEQLIYHLEYLRTGQHVSSLVMNEIEARTGLSIDKHVHERKQEQQQQQSSASASKCSPLLHVCTKLILDLSHIKLSSYIKRSEWMMICQEIQKHFDPVDGTDSIDDSSSLTVVGPLDCFASDEEDDDDDKNDDKNEIDGTNTDINGNSTATAAANMNIDDNDDDDDKNDKNKYYCKLDVLLQGIPILHHLHIERLSRHCEQIFIRIGQKSSQYQQEGQGQGQGQPTRRQGHQFWKLKYITFKRIDDPTTLFSTNNHWTKNQGDTDLVDSYYDSNNYQRAWKVLTEEMLRNLPYLKSICFQQIIFYYDRRNHHRYYQEEKVKKRRRLQQEQQERWGQQQQTITDSISSQSLEMETTQQHRQVLRQSDEMKNQSDPPPWELLRQCLCQMVQLEKIIYENCYSIHRPAPTLLLLSSSISNNGNDLTMVPTKQEAMMKTLMLMKSNCYSCYSSTKRKIEFSSYDQEELQYYPQFHLSRRYRLVRLFAPELFSRR